VNIDEYHFPDDLYYHKEHCWARVEDGLVVARCLGEPRVEADRFEAAVLEVALQGLEDLAREARAAVVERGQRAELAALTAGGDGDLEHECGPERLAARGARLLHALIEASSTVSGQLFSRARRSFRRCALVRG